MRDEPTDRDAAPGAPHVDVGLCADILTGIASRETVSGAMAHVRTCPACEERFRRMAADYEGLRAGPSPRRSPSGEIVLAPREDGLIAPASPRSTGSSGEERSWWGVLRRAVRTSAPRLAPAVALAAAAVVVVFLVRPWSGRVPPPDLAYRIAAGGELLVRRAGAESAGLGELLDGIRAYERRDLRKAIRSLERARAAGGAEDLRLLYLASALQLSGQASRALETVSAIDPEALPEPRRDEALWVRYVALVETGRTGEAADLLVQLAASKGPIGEIARRRQTVISRDSSRDRP